VAIPTLEQEDTKRQSRERESLTGEKTRMHLVVLFGVQ